MPKLYYSPISCGAASFISALTAGVNLECEQIDLQSHRTDSGVDFYTINPKGNVPTIVLDDGLVLNENAATLQWIADQAPGTVAPDPGTPARYELIDALSYISSEFHGILANLFRPLSPEVDGFFREKLAKKLTYIEQTLLGDKQFLVDNRFTVADAYLYICLTWAPYVKMDLSAYPRIQAFVERIGALENVKAAHARMATKPATVI